MEINLIDINGKQAKKVKLPNQFNEEIRPDLIKRAVHVIEANSRQPYGSDPEAGMKYSAAISRRRRKYRGSYGFGISRVPRKIISRKGTRMNWVGAEAPGTVGGRRAHSPKSEKIWDKKINVKERKKALRSALSATVNLEIVKERGHKVPENYPFIVESKFEKINRTKEAINALESFGFKEEMERTSEKKIRSGKATMRNRTYKSKKGLLIVVSGNCEVEKAACNIPGFEVVTVRQLNTKILAPGCAPGRITLYTDKAIEKIEKEKLFE